MPTVHWVLFKFNIGQNELLIASSITKYETHYFHQYRLQINVVVKEMDS